MKQTMKMKLVVLGLVGLSIVAGACNGDSKNESGDSKENTTTASTTVQGETTAGKAVAAAGDITWGEEEQKNYIAYFSFNVPEGWIRKRNGMPTTILGYTGKEVDKKLILAHEGFAAQDDEAKAALKAATLDTLPELLDEQFTAQATLGGDALVDTLIGTEKNREKVTINGREMLRVTGTVDNKSYPDINYVAYYGFMTNEAKGKKDIPFVMAMYIQSDDASDITYGEKLLEAIIQTVKPTE